MMRPQFKNINNTDDIQSVSNAVSQNVSSETLEPAKKPDTSTDDQLSLENQQELEIKKLKSELHHYRVQNVDLKNNNRDLNAKLSRLQNTINNLQRTVREQAVKVLDEMFDGMKK